MAHAPELRLRAQQCYLAGWPAARILRELGVSRATLSRWITAGGWRELRTLQKDLEREAGALVLAMTRAARESRDPQQAYAALQAAQLAGIGGPRDPHPPPAEVAKALLRALVDHPELGPLVRKHRREVLEGVMGELARGKVSAPGSEASRFCPLQRCATG